MPRQIDIAAICLVAGIVLVTACNDSASTASVHEELKPAIALLPTSLPTPKPSPTEAHIDLPSPNFDERRGDTYYYIAAVSEEDRKRGRAVGSVSSFQYLGKNATGEHIVASLRNDGTVSYRAKCAVPCKIIDTDYGEKFAFSPTSIIGAVFDDAFHGRLKVAQWSADPIVQPGQVSPAVPAAAALPAGAGDVPSLEAAPEPPPAVEIPLTDAPPSELVEPSAQLPE